MAPGLRWPDVAGRYRELRAHLRSPLYRNAYALMINTGVTGLLGVAYWLLAAGTTRRSKWGGPRPPIRR